MKYTCRKNFRVYGKMITRNSPSLENDLFEQLDISVRDTLQMPGLNHKVAKLLFQLCVFSEISIGYKAKSMLLIKLMAVD